MTETISFVLNGKTLGSYNSADQGELFRAYFNIRKLYASGVIGEGRYNHWIEKLEAHRLLLHRTDEISVEKYRERRSNLIAKMRKAA